MSDNDSNRQGDLNTADAELAQRLARALDDSVDTFDADTCDQLAMSRHRALAYKRRPQFATAVAIAASLLVLAAMPWMLRDQTQPKMHEDLEYLSVEPEMLADMDMLLAIGEAQ